MTDSSADIQKPRKRKWDVVAKDDSLPHEPDSFKAAKVEKSSDDDKSPDDASVAASTAVAKINAFLKSKITELPIKPIQAAKKPEENVNTAKSDGEFIRDIEINDVKNRYLLTKGATQTQIQKETGADVTTRGVWYPDKSKSTLANPALYLHISATTQENLDAAIEKIHELIEQSPTQFSGSSKERQAGQRQQLQDKVPVPIEPDRSVSLRPKIVGPQGAYVKHIQDVTNTKVILKGKGSGFIEQGLSAEGSEPLHLLVTGWDQSSIEKARQLCEDLIKTAKQEYERAVYERTQHSYGRNPPSQSVGYYRAPPPAFHMPYGNAPPLPPGLPSSNLPPLPNGQPLSSTNASAPYPYPYSSHTGYPPPAPTTTLWPQQAHSSYQHPQYVPSYSYGQPSVTSSTLDFNPNRSTAATSAKLNLPDNDTKQ